MALGVYVHIPYCLQRCSYCDFATYEFKSILPPKSYHELLLAEIRQRAQLFRPQLLSSIYFGGGTPSLIPPEYIIETIHELEKHGFITGPETEITIEINPATLTEDSLGVYLSGGINRFSVGAQTFKDSLLKLVNREHNSEQTLETLALLKKHKLNFNFDLLFALPNQSILDLEKDLKITLEQGAAHISPYCLTLSEAHPLNINRPTEDVQIEMFIIIHSYLLNSGYERYEISNYSKPGYESRHNCLYWQDVNYWGLGLSAHSYRKDRAWGQRFWNPKNIKIYEKLISEQSSPKNKTELAEFLPTDHFEDLDSHQALTDYCHTALRMSSGLNLNKLQKKFSQNVADIVNQRLKALHNRGLIIENTENNFCLSEEGILISNIVFLELSFIEADLKLN